MYLKRTIAAIMSVLILMSCTTGFATTENVTSEKTDEKVFYSSGETDEGITWTLSSAGMLTITGKGMVTADPVWQYMSEIIRFVYITDGITEIGDGAFSGLYNVNSVHIPDSVISIGNNAFEMCALTEITLPKNLETIGDYAFGCSTLSTIYIPKSVKHIGRSLCSPAPSPEFVVEDGNLNYKSVDGILFSSTGDTLYSFPSLYAYNYEEPVFSYTVPEGVTTIADSAFAFLTDPFEIVLPSTLKTIESYAFYMNGFESINIPASVTDIAFDAFSQCYMLKEITVDEASESFSSEYGVLFDKNKTRLIKFPSHPETDAIYEGEYAAPTTLKVIGQQAFENAPNIENFIIYAGLEQIEIGAFMNASIERIEFSSTKLMWESIKIAEHNDILYNIPIIFKDTAPEKEYNVKAGVTYTLTDYINVEEYDDYEEALANLVFSTSNTDVATVDKETLQMTAVAPGEVIITASTSVDGFGYNAAIKVIVLPSDTEEDVNSFVLEQNETLDVKAYLTVPDKFLNSLVWSSSDEDVATADDGVITALGAGEAVIMATLHKNSSGKYSMRFNITVTPKYTDESYFEFSNGVITKYIGSDASVSIPETIGGETVTGIGDYAFQYCKNVIRIDMPKTVTTIGNFAFDNCSSLKSIKLHSGITKIGNGAFNKCSSLIKAVIPNTVTTLGDYLFSGCTKLSTVEFEEGITDIGLSLKGSPLKSVTIPASVTKIVDNAFKDCKYLESIVIPDSVTSLGAAAFYGCSALKSVTIGTGIDTIPNSAFYNCTAIKNIEIPANVKTIANRAFYGCKALLNVKFNEGLTSIGVSAFENCIYLSKIVIPDSVASISNNAFYNCKSLLSATIGSGLIKLNDKIFYDCDLLKTVELGSNIKAIGNYTFYNCTSLENIAIPNGVTTIGNYTFHNCKKLQKVAIPNNVTSIGEYAFNNCVSLTNVTIGTGLKTIAPYSFYNCKALKDITIPGNIKTIGTYAFANCPALTNATFGSGVTAIGNYAFHNCNALKAVNLPNTVESIGAYAFAYNKALTDATLGSGVKTIGNNAFYNCSALQSIDIPSLVTKINDNTFYGCVALENVTFGSNIATIGANAFYNCKALESLDLPEYLTDIGEYAFYNCSSINSIQFNENLEKIEKYAFYGLKALETITVPENVSSIGDYGFAYCTELIVAKILNPNCQLGYNVFYGCDNLNSNEWTGTYKTISDENLGYFTMQLDYKVTRRDLREKKIVVTLPEGTYVMPGSMKLDGKLYTNFEEKEVKDKWTRYYNEVTIYLNNTSGSFTFCIKPMQYGSFSTSATMHVKTNGGRSESKYLGNVKLEMPDITINTADTTGSPQIIVEGSARPFTAVELLVDGVRQATYTTNNAGRYKATLYIHNAVDNHKYKITAKTTCVGTTYTADAYVKYVSSTPVLDRLTYYYGRIGASYRTPCDLYSKNIGAMRPVIQWGNPSRISNHGQGYDYYFQVYISNRQNVDKVYVVSTKDNKKEYLEARWNNSRKCYVTSGYFANDYNYMPGVLTVEYTKNNDSITANISDVSAYVDFQADSLVPSILEYSSTTFGADVEVKTDALKAIFGENIKVEATTVNRNYSGVSANSLCVNDTDYYSSTVTVGGKQYVLNIDLTDTSKAVINVHDMNGGKLITYTIRFIVTDIINEIETENTLNVKNILKRSSEYAEKTAAAFDLDFDEETITNNLRMSNLPDSALNNALTMAESLNIKKNAFLLAATVLSVSKVDNLSAPVEVLDYLLRDIKKDVKYFSDLRILNIYRLGLECKVKWVIDPSGYVYEAVTDNRLEGVTATIYYITNEEAESYGKNEDGSIDYEAVDSSLIKLWDAEEYNQTNPLVTDKNGMYQWDVPVGYWSVTYEKEGYETAHSNWLPVPPPQTKVNVGLVSLEKPVVEDIYLTTDCAVVTFSKYMKPETVNNVTIGDATYTVKYDDAKLDPNNNVLSKIFTFKLDGQLQTGTDYVVTIEGAKSYAGVEMEAYSQTLTTPSEVLPTALLITDVSETDNTIGVNFYNNSGKLLTFNAICTLYDDNNQIADIKMLYVENLANLNEIQKEFKFDKSWSNYKIFVWTADYNQQPVIVPYDSTLNNQ